MLRLRREVWGLGGKRADVRGVRVAREQIDERQTCEALADLPEELAAGSAARRRVRDVAANRDKQIRSG